LLPQEGCQALEEGLAAHSVNDLVFASGERHRFSEFGMNLRKIGLLEEALGCYSRTIAINGEDEFLYFNATRALCAHLPLLKSYF